METNVPSKALDIIVSDNSNIVALSEETLDEAVRLVRKVFPNLLEESEAPEKSFPASIRRDALASKEFLAKTNIPDLRYWIYIDPTTKRVAGTTGLYTYTHDEKEANWLGWLAVDPELRGRGIGRELLEFSIRATQQSGKRFLRLYTSSSPIEQKAHKLYESFGFRKTSETEDIPYGKDEIATLRIITYELDLKRKWKLKVLA